MPLTRSFKETVQARAQADFAFREALLTEGLEAFLSGDLDTGKAVIRDYINATVGFRRSSACHHSGRLGGCLPHSGGAGIPNGATLVDSGDTKTAVSAINGAAGSVGTAVAGAYGSVTINANGAYTYTLNNASAAVQTLAAGQTVTDSFTYTMRDTAGATSSTTLDVTVTGKNDTPVAVANTAAVQEDTITSATGNVLTNDTDDTKTVSAVKGVACNGRSPYHLCSTHGATRRW